MEPSSHHFGSKEVEEIIQGLWRKGDAESREAAIEIRNKIKEQDPELVGYEISMFSSAIMLISMAAGYMAKRYTAKLLEKYFTS